MADKQKDMRKLHDLPKFGDVVKNKNGKIRDYAKGRLIDIKWGWNDHASLDQMVALKFKTKHGDYEEIIIDYQEFIHYARATSQSLKEVEQRLAQEEMARRL